MVCLSPHFHSVSQCLLSFRLPPFPSSSYFACLYFPLWCGATENETTLLRGDERGLNTSHLILSPQLGARRRHPACFPFGWQIIQSERGARPAVIQWGVEHKNMVTGSPSPCPLRSMCLAGCLLGSPAGWWPTYINAVILRQTYIQLANLDSPALDISVASKEKSN